MLFQRYRKLIAVGANDHQLYSTNVDSGHAPLTGLNLRVTAQQPTRVQVGAFDGTTFTPYQTRYCPPGTTGLPFANYVADGSQQVAVDVFNLGAEPVDVYLDMDGTET